MSTENEGSIDGEGQKTPTLEELQAQISSLSETLESEKKSKERILEESKRYKEGFQQYKAKESEAEQQKRELEEERLKKEGQYNVLLEQREAQIKEMEETLAKARGEVEVRDTAINNFKKAAAFERALGGKIKREEYWNMVDFESIATNPENGQIDEASLNKSVNNFIENYKELIDFGNAANLPNGTPSGASTKLTVEQWKKLPVEERKKRMKDVTLK